MIKIEKIICFHDKKGNATSQERHYEYFILFDEFYCLIK